MKHVHICNDCMVHLEMHTSKNGFAFHELSLHNKANIVQNIGKDC
jgi:hypothetical protein